MKQAHGLTHLSYTQEVDCCGPAGTRTNSLDFRFEDGGGGTYVVMETDRWSFNNLEEAIGVLRQVFELRKQHDEYMRNAYVVTMKPEKYADGWEKHLGTADCPVSRYATGKVRINSEVFNFGGITDAYPNPTVIPWEKVEDFYVEKPF